MKVVFVLWWSVDTYHSFLQTVNTYHAFLQTIVHHFSMLANNIPTSTPFVWKPILFVIAANLFMSFLEHVGGLLSTYALEKGSEKPCLYNTSLWKQIV